MLGSDRTQQYPDQTLPAEGAKTAHFCSMKIAHEVRNFAAKQNAGAETFVAVAEVEAEMAEMSGRFREESGEVYLRQ